MGELDYAAVVGSFRDATPDDIPGMLSALVTPIGGRDIVLYLVDFEQVLLQPLPPGERWVAHDWVMAEQDVATSMAGRCFATGQLVSRHNGERVKVWVPLIEQSERTGVLELTLPDADERTLDQCAAAGVFAGLLVTSAARYSDMFHLRRQGRSMTAAAGMQWDLIGHPAPLLMRERRVIGELPATPCLPFGFGDPCSVAREQLHPGDSLLLFTDGVVEGRTPQGEDFGTERLVDLWERESLPERPAEEVARRLTQAIIDHQVGKLHDDSTLMVIQWCGRGD